MYNEFFGFSEDPFNLTPDPRFLFMAIGHFETLSSMLSGIKDRKGITVISGEAGTGKTTLIYTLLKDISDKITTAFVFYTKISFKDLLENILMNLGVYVSNKNLITLLISFRQYLKERIASDETVAIIIDEAQDLEIDVMQDLFRLCSEDPSAAKLVQILLVGQPELEVKLDSLKFQQLKNRVAVRNHLRPLNQEESEAYIDHRLNVVGSSSFKVFTPQAIDRITKFSNGIPRVINIVCDRALLTGYTTSSRKIDEKIANETLKKLSHLECQKTLSRRAVRPLYPIVGIVILTFVLVIGVLYFLNWYSNLKVPLKGRGKPVLLEEVLAKKEKSIEKEIPAKKTTERIVSVKKGWTLSSMALQYYNNVNPTLLDVILEFNPEITDLNRIFVYQQIRIQGITEELLLIQAPDGSYKIYLGTFSDERSAHPLKNSVVLKGKKLEVVPRKVSPQDTWFRLMAGDYKTREDSLKAIRALRQQDLLPAFAGSPG